MTICIIIFIDFNFTNKKKTFGSLINDKKKITNVWAMATVFDWTITKEKNHSCINSVCDDHHSK